MAKAVVKTLFCVGIGLAGLLGARHCARIADYVNIVPPMSAANPLGIVMLSSVPGTQENAWAAFDGKFDGPVFHSAPDATNGSLTLCFDEPVRVGRIGFSPQDSLPLRLPADFSFEGGDDCKNWNMLFSSKNTDYGQLKAGQFKNFRLPTTGFFRCYRLNALAVGKGERFLAFSEFSLQTQSLLWATKAFVAALLIFICLWQLALLAGLPKVYCRVVSNSFCAVIVACGFFYIWRALPSIYYERITPKMHALVDKEAEVSSNIQGTQANAWGAFNREFGGEIFHSDLDFSTGTITVSLSRPAIADRLRIAPQTWVPSRSPRDFILEADNGDEKWTQLAKVRGFSFEDLRLPGSADFTLPGGKAFSRYRLSVSAVNGDRFISMSEIGLDRRVDNRPAKLILCLLFAAFVAALLKWKNLADIIAAHGAKFPPSEPVWAALLLPSLLLCLMPLRIYLSNPADLYYGFAVLAPLLALLAALVCGVLLAVLHFIPEGAVKDRALALLVVSGGLCWLQFSVWPWRGGALDGTPLVLGTCITTHALQLVIWACAIIFALLAAKIVNSAARGIAVALVATQLFCVVIKLSQLPQMEKTKTASTNPLHMFRFSGDKQNVLLIVLDMFQSDLFDDIATAGPVAGLDGFTYYRNTSSACPLTICSIPHVLTGRYFDNNVRLEQFVRDSFTANSLFKSASSAGFDVAARAWIPGEFYLDSSIAPVAERGISLSLLVWDPAVLLDNTLFACAPDSLKHLFYADGRWLFSGALSRVAAGSSGTIPVPNSSKAGDVRFVNSMLAGTTAQSRVPTFKFFHLSGNHPPFDTDSSLRRTGKLALDRAGYTEQAQGALKLLEFMLEELKRKGVYDNSMIFIFGDHGMGTAVKRLPGHSGGVFEGWLARGVPLLLVKDFGSSGPLKVTDAPAHLGDIAHTITARLGWVGDYPGEDLFSLKEGSERARPYVSPSGGYLLEGKFPSIEHYSVTGHSWDSASWCKQ